MSNTMMALVEDGEVLGSRQLDMGNSSLKELRLIVNADDLGISQEANREIFRLMEKGLVTSATAIANGPYIEQACTQIENFPGCSFGAHLNLTEFTPLTGEDQLAVLLDETGCFNEQRVRTAHIDSRLAGAIFQELCAQVEQLTALGLVPGHLDSHHHVHTLPRIFPILKRVQRKYGIRRVRLSRNIYGPGESTPVSLRLKKTAYNFLLKHFFPTKTTQGFTDFKTFHQCAISGTLNHRFIELMVHPGYEPYAQETELLSEDWQEACPLPVRLVSYSDLV